MAKPWFTRIAGAAGATSLAVLFVSLTPFLSAGPTAGAGLPARPAPFTVNREFKGDRLPLPATANDTQGGVGRKVRTQTPAQVPVGCDASFSPISAPQLTSVYGRCLT